MYDKEAMLMMLQTLTPTHAGSGTQISYVDLPIQRESHTDFPKIEASTLKGCIRCAVGCPDDESDKEQKTMTLMDRIFGLPGSGDFASAVSFTDARLLFFPVKSAIGIFAWITCPYVLKRFLKDYDIVETKKIQELKPPEFTFPNEEGTAFCSSLGNCVLKATVSDKREKVKELKSRILLEDYTYELKESKDFSKLLGLLHGYLPDCSGDDDFQNRAIMLSDDDFGQFVKYSTEISTRIKIDSETGTVNGTALFTEEFLPPESILYSIVICNASHVSQKEERKAEKLTAVQVRDIFCGMFDQVEIFQIGADSTLGKGLVKKSFL